MRDHAKFRALRKILQPSVFSLLTVIALNGWCESVPQNCAFIFIEQKPPFTSEDRTVRSTAVYLNEKGLVQRYSCENDKVNDLREGSLPVAGADIFKTLSVISLMSLPGRQDPDPNQPPSQAHPGHARIVVRQSGGAEYLWEGNDDKIPFPLQKLVWDSLALALKLSTVHTSGLAVKLNTAKPPAGAFLRADILSADTLAEYRVNKLLKTVNTLAELDSVLQEALCNPFCLIHSDASERVPAPEREKREKSKNPFSAFAIKGASSSFPLLYNGTGYEVSRYSSTLPPGP